MGEMASVGFAALGSKAVQSGLSMAGRGASLLKSRLGFTAEAALQAERSLAGTMCQQMEKTAIAESFEIARQGGKHSGFLQNNIGRSAEELERGITSLEKQIELHQNKIKNPSHYIEDWAKLDFRQRQALIEKKWPSDIKRQMEQRDILQAIMKEMN